MADRFVTPEAASNDGLPRRYVETTAPATTYYREEVFVAPSTVAAGSTDVTAKQGAGSTANPWSVTQGTTPWVIIGETTAILTSASKVQVEPAAGVIFPVSGNTTVVPLAGSTWSVAPAAGTTFPISGNTTAFLSTASTVSVVAGSTFPVTGPVSNAALAQVADTITSNGDSVVTGNDLTNYGSVLVTVNGAYTLISLAFELSDDSGTTYYATTAIRLDTGAIYSGLLSNNSLSFLVATHGATTMRVRATAFGSGAMNVRITPVAGRGVSTPTPVDSELPAAAALSDALANPNTPQVGSNLLGFDAASGVWARARLNPSDGSGLFNNTDPVLAVVPTFVNGAVLQEFDGGAAGLNVHVTTSTVSVVPGAGTTFNVAGDTTAIISTASKLRIESTAPLPTSGDTTVFPGANTTFKVRDQFGANGRIQVHLFAYVVAPTSNEALVTLDRTTAYTTAAAATTYNISAGRVLRIQTINLTHVNTTNVPTGCFYRMHCSSLSGGAVTTASPIVWTGQSVAPTTNINAGGMFAVPFPDGLEVTGGSSGRDLALGLITGSTAVGTAGTTNCRVTVSIQGFEYTT